MNKDMIIVEERNERVIANEINFIKRRTCEAVLSASVEIGRLLCEAKTKVAPGEWMKWLEENVNYSQSTANNLMRLYDEYGEQSQTSFFEENRLEIFGNISPSQALALIALPYEKRKEFVETHDMDTTSVRDINAEIKARKEAEERAELAESENKRLSSLIEAKEADEADYAANIEELEKELEEARKKLEENEPHESALEAEKEILRKEIESEYTEKLKAAEKEAKNKAKEKLDKLKEELSLKDSDFEKKLAEETEKAKAEAKSLIEKQYIEQIDKLTNDNASLRKKADAASNSAVQKFSVHFELFQKEGQLLLGLLNELSADEALSDVAQKLKNGFSAVIGYFVEATSNEHK